MRGASEHLAAPWSCGQRRLRHAVTAACLFAVPAAAAANPLITIAQREDILAARNSEVLGSARIGIDMMLIMGEGVPEDAQALARIGEPVPPDSAPRDNIGKLEVRDGTIIVTLGGEAREDIAGETFALSPCVAEEGPDVRWACGLASCPTGYTLAPGAHETAPLTTLEPVQLTVDCR